MCGIAGYLGSDSQGAPRLASMVASLERRGPDARDWRVWPEAGLGAARLAMVGGDAGAQPAELRPGGPALVLNGEIYNWRDLAASAGQPGTPSDTVSVLRRLSSRGVAALSELRGGFSLALWQPEERRLLLARDEFGQKPLYVREMASGVQFASSIKALIAAGYRPERDPEGLTDLAQLQFLRPDRTLFAGIRSVEPGTWISFEMTASGIRRESGSFSFAAPKPDELEDPGLIASAFEDALRLQAPGEHPAALFLSGGLDSSVLAMGAARVGLEIERAYVGFFPDESVPDERPHAREVAAASGITLEEVELDPLGWADAWPRAMATLEMPFAGPGSVSQWWLGRRAAANGARIVYGGQGGDELFGGYERLRILQSLAAAGRARSADSYAGLAHKMQAAFERGGIEAAYAAAVGRGLSAPFAGSESDGPKRRAAYLGRACDLGRFGWAEGDPLDAAEEFERRIFLPGLLAVDDRCVAHFSMEGRLPFLDQRFASLARGVPLARKSPADAPRRLFRNAFGDWIPPGVAGRKDKCGFAVPLASWFGGPLRGFVEERLLDARSLARGLWTAEEARALLGDLNQSARLVFHLVSLDMWHRAFLESPDNTREPDAMREAGV